MAGSVIILKGIKAGIGILTDKNLRKIVGWIIAIVLSPIILIIVLVCALLTGTTNHNKSAVELCLNGGDIPRSMPAEYVEYIEDMRNSLAVVDTPISDVSSYIESENCLDKHMVRAIFYSLFFGSESLTSINHYQFVDCFVSYEERINVWTDENGIEHEETYIAAVPIEELEQIYINISSEIGISITEENKVNAAEIYNRSLKDTGKFYP